MNPIDNVSEPNLLERWFPWTREGPSNGILSKKDSQLIKPQPKNQIAKPSDAKQIADTIKSPTKLEKEGKNHSISDLVDTVTQDISIDPPKRLSVLEMWNFLESNGIKRESVDKVFTTEDAIRELYRTVYKRVHFEREQEMIKRLKTYVEKLQNQNVLLKGK